jgi:hypothetical protein
VDRRRFLLTSLAGALAAPLSAGAQQAARVARIGVLTVEDAGTLRQSLRDLGYIEGRNTILEIREHREDPSRLSSSHPSWQI